jgi:hypothetical protein
VAPEAETVGTTPSSGEDRWHQQLSPLLYGKRVKPFFEYNEYTLELYQPLNWMSCYYAVSYNNCRTPDI